MELKQGVKESPPIKRSHGVTHAERHVQALCERTFLSLWSYAGVHRDQGTGGKEVADLLVVFGDDLIVFSDKDCAFPDTGDTALDWARWFKRAVFKGAEQAWGAERWIRTHPDRLFLDEACTDPFPLDLPLPDQMRFHHIVVAHNATERCRKHFGGGSGSLMINNQVVDADHTSLTGPALGPFVVGDLDPTRGFVHVFDDTTLDVVLNSLDTVADFTAYLIRKEDLLRSGKVVVIAGEEELLARYQMNLDEDGGHGFDIPDDVNGFVLDEGHWLEFENSDQYKARVAANEISYAWDRLIETFNTHIIEGRYYTATDPAPRVREKIVCFLTSENRFRRRILARNLIEMIEGFPIDNPDWKNARIVPPGLPHELYYVFLVVGQPTFVNSNSEYRKFRGSLLEAYCTAAKHICPDATDIIGIATEPGHFERRSEDALWLDARDWTEEMAANAKRLHEETGLFSEITTFGLLEKEFPEPVVIPKNPRNKPCPCGSNRKYKHCCGRA